ncbi:T9SS-dependent M36 family metallopeptidase [Lacinutrix algicola]|uniref:T9SS-dependent M36 family metallopeptidase n=1 Tax=Lacinutrix algicola TaxID=342954 RepID=UPI0006E2A08C|nr:T9SS-dependent M36 family metallopeptidase [Lacinutrix algicola]
MKKNYIVCLIATVFLFAFQIGQAQSSLANNEFGSQIQNWLNQNKEKYDLTENDLSNLIVSNSFFSKKTKINHVYVNQAYQGIKIHNAISSVAVRDNNVFHYNNGLVQNVASKVNAITPVINAQEAIQLVADNYNLGSVSNLELIDSSHNKYVFNTGNISQSNIPVELVLQKTENDNLVLAWNLNIFTLNGKNSYGVRVNAINGDIIVTDEHIISCDFGNDGHTNHNGHNTFSETKTVNLFKNESMLMADGSQYNVFAIPTESPNHGSITLVSDPADDNASPFGWHDTDGLAGAEYTITRGNNVWAKDDVAGDNTNVGYAPEGGASLDFNFAFSPDQQPIGYRDVAITNLFYMNNIMHDVWYQYGFDEVSGNFQLNNYGNGGAGGDFVFADAQDGSGNNNANFSTPTDGSNPRMQMFLWNASGALSDILTVNNGSLAGSYSAGRANFGAILNSTPVTEDLVLLIDDNSGFFGSTDVNDGCDTAINSAELNGKIAILRRGACEFGVKALSAQNAGAIGVIVVNNVADPVINMAPGAVGNQVTIPSVMVSQLEGNALIAALNNGETVNVTLSDPGPYVIDGDIDNGIVSHEYGHGISTRLVGGALTSSCLFNPEQMGEGWSDWFALMLTMKASDLPETGRGIATYSQNQPVDGAGIRPAKYSTDFAVNDFTYGATNDNTFLGNDQNGNPIYWNTVVHNVGFVWSTVLWDLSWAYIDKYGFDADVYNGTGGNNKAMQLVIDGLKLLNCSPGMVDGRNALLAADTALTGGEDQCLIWEVFAARGLGASASQGSSSAMEDQVEDFTMPPSTIPSLQNCTSLSVKEFNTSNYSIFPNPTNNVLNIKVKKNFGDVTMSLTDINGRIVLTKKANLSSETQLNISALQSGMYILTIKGEGINTNDKILKN